MHEEMRNTTRRRLFGLGARLVLAGPAVLAVLHIAGGAAHAERRQRRQRRAGAQPVAERRAHRAFEAGHHRGSSSAISARSCAISAFIASPAVQTRNTIASDGASWPAIAMSAAITVAIFG